MEKDVFLDKLASAIGELSRPDEALQFVSDAFSNGASVLEVTEKGVRKGLDIVGGRYQNGEYYLAELMYGASIAQAVMEEIQPRLAMEEMEKTGTIVMGTVLGDIHDLGKDIAKTLLKVHGWEVYDLGVDVRSEAFADKVQEVNPDVLGMTSLLTTTVFRFGETLDILKERGLRNKVKVIIAGNAATESVAEKIGADGVARDAETGIRLCGMWVGK